jgi:hypothetical protein
MIYAPNSFVDQRLLSHSRELVREALALLRESDHLVGALRLRDELAQEHRRPPDGTAQHADREPLQG